MICAFVGRPIGFEDFASWVRGRGTWEVKVRCGDDSVRRGCREIGWGRRMNSADFGGKAVVQNSNSSAQQDALILSVIEQLKTQVINWTKINLDNKSVNDTLTAELERYKKQVKGLKEGQNVKNSMNSSDPSPSCTPTRVEVPKELPKVSMVNTSLKKLRYHLAGFDVVVRERTMTTAITEGS
nr:hypothetical protein [Tanacetum cinerariifolium]